MAKRITKEQYLATRYEMEKQKLRRLNLPPDVYEKRLREITKRLGV